MSLTRLLREREDVARLLSSLVSSRAASRVTLGPMYDGALGATPYILSYPPTDHYALIGTGFDYMLRFEIQRRNPSAVDEEWIAHKALALIRDTLPEGSTTEKLYGDAIGEAEAVVRAYQKLSAPSNGDMARLAQACVVLAKADGFYRNAVVDLHVNKYEPVDVADMCVMFLAVPWRALGADPGTRSLLNPSFGRLSTLFNGADADLIADDVLIDFKTTKYFDTVQHYPQLVGYSILARECRLGGDTRMPVLRSAGIYFARHGALVTFSLEDIYGHPDYESAKDVLIAAAAERHTDGVAFA